MLPTGTYLWIFLASREEERSGLKIRKPCHRPHFPRSRQWHASRVGSLIAWTYTWERKSQEAQREQRSEDWKSLKTLGHQEGSAGKDTKPEALTLIPRTPVAEGEKQLSQTVFWSSHAHLELEVQPIMSSPVGAQNWSQVFCKSSQGSSLLSYPSIPYPKNY